MSARIAGTFTGTGNSASARVLYAYNVSLVFAGTGTVLVRRSFDDGVTWETLRTVTNASPSTERFYVGTEPEMGVLYRFECSAHGGNITYRLGSDGLTA